jgi:hypothetical protein
MGPLAGLLVVAGPVLALAEAPPARTERTTAPPYTGGAGSYWM